MLTHSANDTFMIGTSVENNFYLRGVGGGGKFLNLGTFVQNDWYRLVNLQNGLTFENQGTISFPMNEGSITLDGTTTMFVNNGTINVTANGYIGATAAGATFTTFDGSTLQGVNFTIAAGSELGLGCYYNNNGSTLTGQVKIATLSIGSGGRLSLCNVNMALTTPATLTAAGGLYLGYAPTVNRLGLATLALGNDATWNFGGGVISEPSTTAPGNLLKLQGHSLTNIGMFVVTANQNTSLDGGAGGRLVIPVNSIFSNSAGYYGIVLTNGATVENQGTMVLAAGNIPGVAIDGTSRFFNNGGTISVLASQGAQIGAIGDGGIFTSYDTNSGAFQPLTLNISNNATFSLGASPNAQVATKRLDGRVKFTAMNVATGCTLSIGQYNNLTFAGAFTATGTLSVANNATFALDTNLTVNFGQGMVAGSTSTLDTRGNTLTLQGNSNIVCLAGSGNNSYIVASNATGYVDNQGTLYIGPAGGSSYYGLQVTHSTGGIAFVNDGTVVIRGTDMGGAATYAMLLISAGTTFSNAAGGTLVRTGSVPLTTPWQATVYGKNSGTSVFDNQGTVQVMTNLLKFYNVIIPEIAGTSLNGGTWKATGPTAVLNLPGSNLVTINTNAAVYLENGGSITTMGTALLTNNGAFFVNGMTFTNGGGPTGLVVGATGTLGGNGTLSSNVTVRAGGTLSPGNTTSAGTLTINGNVNFQTGASYKWVMDAVTNDRVVVNGTLTLPAVASVNVTNLLGGRIVLPAVLFQATTLAGATSVSGWTVTPSDLHAIRSGNTVILDFSSGAVFVFR